MMDEEDMSWVMWQVLGEGDECWMRETSVG